MDEHETAERTTLEELEHFQQQIRLYKAQREAVGQEFDRFIRSFSAAEQAASPPPLERALVAPIPHIESIEPGSFPTESHASEPGAPESFTPPSRLPAGRDEASVPVRSAPAPAAPVSATPVPAAPARRQTGARTGVLIGGTLVLLAGGALVTWTLRSRAPESPATGSRTAPPAVPPAVPAVRETPPTTATTQGSELTTKRAAWVRVIADGERVVERELPPDARIPLRAEKTIVIRTGDAGAVRLTLHGRDQGFLGRDGEVVTRNFTVPRHGGR